MLCWHPSAIQGPHTVDGRALWAHVVHIDMIAWRTAGKPTRTIIDAQGEFLARFPGTLVECDDRTLLWDGWTMLCPATKSVLSQWSQRYPQWVHRPTWDAVPASHAGYLPVLKMRP